MSEHWKFGDGFAIRYGGYQDIQWFKSEELSTKSIGLSLPPSHPFAVVVEALKVAAMFLQWWEMRKQNLLQTAQFEERRILWLIDILAQWHSELQQNTIRLDTISYLDREISRLLTKILENNLMDVPSSLLLQIERSAYLMANINQALSDLLKEVCTGFVMGNSFSIGSSVPFTYQPFYKLQEQQSQYEDYIQTINKVIGTANPVFIGIAAFNPIPVGILWTVSKLNQSKQKLSKERLQEFSALEALSVELRSSDALLRVMKSFPSSMRTYSTHEIDSAIRRED